VQFKTGRIEIDQLSILEARKGPGNPLKTTHRPNPKPDHQTLLKTYYFLLPLYTQKKEMFAGNEEYKEVFQSLIAEIISHKTWTDGGGRSYVNFCMMESHVSRRIVEMCSARQSQDSVQPSVDSDKLTPSETQNFASSWEEQCEANWVDIENSKESLKVTDNLSYESSSCLQNVRSTALPAAHGTYVHKPHAVVCGAQSDVPKSCAVVNNVAQPDLYGIKERPRQ
jgi:hypothetical protein